MFNPATLPASVMTLGGRGRTPPVCSLPSPAPPPDCHDTCGERWGSQIFLRRSMLQLEPDFLSWLFERGSLRGEEGSHGCWRGRSDLRLLLGHGSPKGTRCPSRRGRGAGCAHVARGTGRRGQRQCARWRGACVQISSVCQDDHLPSDCCVPCVLPAPVLCKDIATRLDVQPNALGVDTRE